MGYVSDLTTSVIDQLGITQFPALMVLKYNFEKEQMDVTHFQSKDLAEHNYQQIK